MHDVVIVGGGVAGLAAGWRLRGKDVLLLESEPRVGGRIRSERRGDYWLNFGAHVFNGPGSATHELLAQTGVAAIPVPGSLAGLAMNGKVLTDGRVNTYPFRVPMSWSSRAALLRAGAKVRLKVGEYGRIATPRPGEDYQVRQQRMYDFLGDRSFADYVGRLPEDAWALFRPTVIRSSGEPDQISAGAGVGYFHLVWNRTGGLSRNIVGGPNTFIDALAAGIEPSIVRRAEVQEVTQHRDHVTVRYTHDGSEHTATARYAVLTTPAPITRRLVTDLPAEVADALGRVSYGSYVSAAFLTNETTPQVWDSSYAIATPKRSFVVVLNMTSLARGQETERRPGSSLMVFSPANLARDLIDLDDAAIKQRYTQDLEEIFPGFTDTITEVEVARFRLGSGYCFPGRGKLQPLLTRPIGRVRLAGDYLGTWFTETSIQTAFRAADDILRELGGGAG